MFASFAKYLPKCSIAPLMRRLRNPGTSVPISMFDVMRGTPITWFPLRLAVLPALQDVDDRGVDDVLRVLVVIERERRVGKRSVRRLRGKPDLGALSTSLRRRLIVPASVVRNDVVRDVGAVERDVIPDSESVTSRLACAIDLTPSSYVVELMASSKGLRSAPEIGPVGG